jgi:hypothetical protein
LLNELLFVEAGISGHINVLSPRAETFHAWN